jgi:hypothetical protein
VKYVDFRHTHCIDVRAKTEKEISSLKLQLFEKCFSEVELSDEPTPSELSPTTEHIAAEVAELKNHFFLQSQTIISMAKEVIEHKEALKVQGENLASLVSEAAIMIEQLIADTAEQDETIDSLEETIHSLEERLLEIEGNKMELN